MKEKQMKRILIYMKIIQDNMKVEILFVRVRIQSVGRLVHLTELEVL